MREINNYDIILEKAKELVRLIESNVKDGNVGETLDDIISGIKESNLESIKEKIDSSPYIRECVVIRLIILVYLKLYYKDNTSICCEHIINPFHHYYNGKIVLDDYYPIFGISTFTTEGSNLIFTTSIKENEPIKNAYIVSIRYADNKFNIKINIKRENKNDSIKTYSIDSSDEEFIKELQRLCNHLLQINIPQDKFAKERVEKINEMYDYITDFCTPLKEDDSNFCEGFRKIKNICEDIMIDLNREKIF